MLSLIDDWIMKSKKIEAAMRKKEILARRFGEKNKNIFSLRM